MKCGLLFFLTFFVVCTVAKWNVRGERDFNGKAIKFASDDPMWLIPWVPVDWRNTPKANSTDEVEVYYLVAPLMEESYGKLLASFDAFHGAIAFFNKRTNFSLTINYDASDFVHSTFPQITTFSNGTRGVVWSTEGSAYVYLGINHTYWTEYSTHVATVSGSIYNDFIENWNSKINTTNPSYVLFSIWDHWEGTQYVKSWDCFDFCKSAFEYLNTKGAKFESVQVKRNFANLYTSTPPQTLTQQYYSSPIVHKEIVEYYEFLEGDFKDMNIVDILWDIYALYEGTYYPNLANQIYKIDLQYPFVGVDWVPFDMPSKK